tara:strand:+ start:2192 stop:2743 length:552 start_codon:yes stop_codon:yes gene_type:complete
MRNYKIAYSIITGLKIKAWECQVEKGTYQLPADSTFDKPLVAKNNYNVIYSNGKWNYKKIPEPPKPKAPTLAELKEAKILEAKAKREEKLYNFIVDEGIIEAKNRAETVLILEGYKKMLDQNITLAEFGLKDGKLIKLTKTIIEKWLLAIKTQVNQAWLDYRAIVKKINNAKTITTLKKIETK